MQALKTNTQNWMDGVIKQDQIDKYMQDGHDFIKDDEIWEKLNANEKPEKQRVRDIIAKALAIETLSPDETACLLNVTDEDLWQEIFEAAARIKHKVYDNRIVTFAPLYISNLCVNNCRYCGFKRDNKGQQRHRLTRSEIEAEIRTLAGEIGHKRLIVVSGEHPLSDVDYLVDSIRTIYAVKEPTRRGVGQIRRVNVNVAPMSIEDLSRLKEAGLGTYQVFQETYHHATYAAMHPEGTLKADYAWRLYCHHRAMEAGVDDVATGVLFGLYDWRFEVMGLQYHALDLERQFGIGPHTVSFPRMEPAADTDIPQNSPYKVSDRDFKRLVAVIRLSIPYTGMILTAREPEDVRSAVIPVGITQIDASSRIGIGAYSDASSGQEEQRQQFILGDTRSLDEVIGDLAARGIITSFCTAGYRCGRTGDKIMGLLRSGREGQFCKLNAILTYREWLDDFAGEATRAEGLRLIEKELAEVGQQLPDMYTPLLKSYERIVGGERDLFF